MKKGWSLAVVLLTMGSTIACSSDGGIPIMLGGILGAQENKEETPLKKVELKIFLGGLDRFREQLDNYFTQFAEKEKKEKNIEVSFKTEYPGNDNASQILKIRLATGDVPDLFNIHAMNDLANYYKAGYLADLSSQPLAAKLLDGIKPLVTIDNKVVAVPMESLEWGYLYNKKIFNALGLKPPTTISGMRAVIQTLNDNSIKPFLLSYKESWIPQLFLSLAVGGLVNTSHKDFIDKMNKNQGSFAELKEMFNIIDLVNENGTDHAFDIGNDDGAADFASGKAAMWVQGPWDADGILKIDPSFEFGVAPLPINDDPKATLINVAVSTSLAMAPNCKNKEVAQDLLNYMLDDQASNDLYQSLKFNPVSLKHTYKPYPWVEDATSYVNKGLSYKDLSIPSAVKDEVGKALQAYYLNKMTQYEVIQTLDKAWKDANSAVNKK